MERSYLFFSGSLVARTYDVSNEEKISIPLISPLRRTLNLDNFNCASDLLQRRPLMTPGLDKNIVSQEFATMTTE
ncbi:hypothetical protein TNCV_1987321 [Trichonephila clavipes]|nr:hypothetical protein TNCV_1987321 [Trichonephila clavipes]